MADARVQEAFRLLREAGRLDLIQSGVGGPSRPTRRASSGVAAAVLACSESRGAARKHMGTLKETEKEKIKEKRQLKEASLSKELLLGSKLPLATASNAIAEDACCTPLDSLPFKANTVSQTLCSPPHTHMSISPLGRAIAISPMEGMMGQILEELQAIKLSHEEACKETKDQFSQLNAHLTLLSAGVVQTEQRVSDLADGKKEQ
ncbi:hypothetical protein NDU88_008532 [Pleurodeles waltl]|uniref:Uncharacterized protein n=1 Tax=Pleurodeles waltl TaxID=8319 RepID=A0AAV7PPE7_PLEWA|nr:hypothetical protein NDU88_008532 [Pleurodeles waltl]